MPRAIAPLVVRTIKTELRNSQDEMVEALYPMPKSALIPVTVIWLGFGDGSKILLIFLGCMLPVTIGAFNGARSADRTLVWSARSLGAGRLRMLRDVVLPPSSNSKLS